MSDATPPLPAGFTVEPFINKREVAKRLGSLFKKHLAKDVRAVKV